MTEPQTSKPCKSSPTPGGAERLALYLAAGGLALAGLSCPAAALGNALGASSTGSVNISVSVAPSFSVAAILPATAAGASGPIDADRLCIKTNALLSSLPVTAILVEPAAGSQGAESLPSPGNAAAGLSACTEKPTSIPPFGTAASAISRLVLVRPE